MHNLILNYNLYVNMNIEHLLCIHIVIIILCFSLSPFVPSLVLISLVVCPCMNNGICSPENFTAYNETVCACPEVYTGDLCKSS